MARKSGSQNGSGQHVISCLLVGWIWGNRSFLLERPIVPHGYPDSQSVSQPAKGHARFPDPRHMRGLWDLSERRVPRGLACSCDWSEVAWLSPTTRTPTAACSAYTTSWLVSTPVAKQRGNWGKDGGKWGNGLKAHRGSGVTRLIWAAAASYSRRRFPKQPVTCLFDVTVISFQAVSGSQTQHVSCNSSLASPSPLGQKTS